MSYITFTPGQSVSLMSIHGASISQALQATLELVAGTTLEYADLVYDGFTMGVYLDSDINNLEEEYWNWKNNKTCNSRRLDTPYHACDCPICYGTGEYSIGGSFGNPVTTHKCDCGIIANKENVIKGI